MIEALRAAADRRGIVLPECYVADGDWHEAQDGAYLLFRALPFIALLSGCNGGDPEVWQPAERVLSLALRRRIVRALEQCPIERRPQEVPTRAPALAASPEHRVPTPARPPTPACEVNDTAAHAAPSALSARARSVEAAACFLATLLSSGAIATVRIRAESERSGHSWSTVRRAAAALGVNVTRRGFGAAGVWSWALKEAQ